MWRWLGGGVNLSAWLGNARGGLFGLSASILRRRIRGQLVEPSSPHFKPHSTSISNTTALSGMEAMNQLQVRLKT